MGPRAGGLGARFRETLPRSAGCVDVAPLTVRHRYDCGSVQDGDAGEERGDSDRAYARFEWVGCVFRWSDIRRYGSLARQNGNTGLSRLETGGERFGRRRSSRWRSSRADHSWQPAAVTARNWTPPLSQTWHSPTRLGLRLKRGKVWLLLILDGGEYRKYRRRTVPSGSIAFGRSGSPDLERVFSVDPVTAFQLPSHLTWSRPSRSRHQWRLQEVPTAAETGRTPLHLHALDAHSTAPRLSTRLVRHSPPHRRVS